MVKSNEEIFKKQLEAYNNKNVEGCLKYFSEDLIVTILPNEKKIASSKQEIRTHMSEQIKSNDFLEAKIINISSNGPFVISTEVKENNEKKTTINIIYYFENGLITKMWGAPNSEKI